MAVTQRQVASGVGGASIGLVGAEATRHAVERDIISPGVGWGIVGTGAAASLGLAGADLAGLVSLPRPAPSLLAGVGAGSTSWYAARSAGVAPRLTIDIPEQINLAGPLATTFAITSVGVAAGTLISLVA